MDIAKMSPLTALLKPAQTATKPAVEMKKPSAAENLRTLMAMPAVGKPSASISSPDQFRALADLPTLSSGAMNHLEGDAKNDAAKVAKAAREFEAVFLRYLASAMNKSVSAGTKMEGAHFYQGMIDEQFGRILAESGKGLGLQDAMIKRLNTVAEGENHD